MRTKAGKHKGVVSREALAERRSKMLMQSFSVDVRYDYDDDCGLLCPLRDWDSPKATVAIRMKL